MTPAAFPLQRTRGYYPANLQCVEADLTAFRLGPLSIDRLAKVTGLFSYLTVRTEPDV